jgi:hypothetical protein
MNRADANFSAIAGVVLLCAGLLLIGWLGDKSGLIDALGLKAQPVATPRAANLKR